MPAIINAPHDTFASHSRHYSRNLRLFQRDTQIQRRILFEPEFIQEEGRGAFPAHQQRFSGGAADRPALDEGIQVFFGIDSHHQHTQRLVGMLRIENRRQYAQIDLSTDFVTIEICDRYPPRLQGFERLLAHMPGKRL